MHPEHLTAHQLRAAEQHAPAWTLSPVERHREHAMPRAMVHRRTGSTWPAAAATLAVCAGLGVLLAAGV